MRIVIFSDQQVNGFIEKIYRRGHIGHEKKAHEAH